jgi:hypothetical protein
MRRIDFIQNRKYKIDFISKKIFVKILKKEKILEINKKNKIFQIFKLLISDNNNISEFFAFDFYKTQKNKFVTIINKKSYFYKGKLRMFGSIEKNKFVVKFSKKFNCNIEKNKSKII